MRNHNGNSQNTGTPMNKEQARHNNDDANGNRTMHNNKVDRKPQIPLDTNADALLKGKNPTNDGGISQRQVTKPINLVGRSPPYKTTEETLGINGSKITETTPKIPQGQHRRMVRLRHLRNLKED